MLGIPGDLGIVAVLSDGLIKTDGVVACESTHIFGVASELCGPLRTLAPNPIRKPSKRSGASCGSTPACASAELTPADPAIYTFGCRGNCGSSDSVIPGLVARGERRHRQFEPLGSSRRPVMINMNRGKPCRHLSCILTALAAQRN